MSWVEALTGSVLLALCLTLVVVVRRWEPGTLLYVRANALYTRGDTARARLLFRQLLEKHPSIDSVNADVCLSIAAGRYREALRTTVTTPELHRSTLLFVNQAEALYCLGRWGRAERVMRAVLKERKGDALVSRAGLELQLAWILASTGRGAEARSLADGADVKRLPREYRAEGFFTRAVSALAAGDAAAAERALETARKHLVRMSSKRNFLFLRARVLWALGRRDEALEAAKQAAEHRYRFQGGDGLLFYGDALRELGRGADAKAAWAQCAQQDPESEAALTAAQRLASC